jgi:hypothetical protein
MEGTSLLLLSKAAQADKQILPITLCDLLSQNLQHKMQASFSRLLWNTVQGCDEETIGKLQAENVHIRIWRLFCNMSSTRCDFGLWGTLGTIFINKCPLYINDSVAVDIFLFVVTFKI